MKAWAILLESKKETSIQCVFADTQPEAFGRALAKKHEDLEDGEEMEDYSISIWDCEEVPSVFPNTPKTPPHHSGTFEEQIKSSHK